MTEQSMVEIFKGQMLSYYDAMIEHNGGIESVRNNIPVLKVGIVAEMLQVYVKSMLTSVRSAKTEGEQINAIFVIEMVNKIRYDMDSLDYDDVDSIKTGLISVLTNVKTPAYDLSKMANVRSNMIDDAKEVFNMMAEFLQD